MTIHRPTATVQEIKDFIKCRIENVPNKQLILEYIFNDKGFGEIYEFYTNKDIPTRSKYTEFITNDMIENTRNLFYEYKDYINNLKIGDKIQTKMYMSKQNGIITKLNYKKSKKDKTKKVLNSIGFRISQPRMDGTIRTQDYKIEIGSIHDSIIYRNIQSVKLQDIREHIIRYHGTFGKYTVKDYNEMMENLI